jgi:hypothetical protein
MVSTPRSSSRPPLSPAPLNWISRPPKPLNPHGPGALCRCARFCSQRTRWRRRSFFAIRPLDFPIILRSVYVSCTFYGKPPRLIPPFAHKSHPTLL